MRYSSSWRRSPRSRFAIRNLKPSGLRRSTPASLFQQRQGHSVIYSTAAVFGVGFLVSFLHAWFIRWITEFAVTDRRVIYKCGFIKRHTVEMNMDKIESVDVDQSLLGRMLN